MTIHALGVLLCLPHILEAGETIESVSLGAGNTGRQFDLETNRRIAEFKFIHWRGGADTARQNSTFKDFYYLEQHRTSKRKILYLLGTQHALSFLKGGRNLESVLSRDNKLRTTFLERFGEQYQTVNDYFATHHSKVEIEDVSPWLPELFASLSNHMLARRMNAGNQHGKYWAAFHLVLNKQNGPVSGNRKPQPDGWMDYAVGRGGFRLFAWRRPDGRVGTGLYIWGDKAKSFFELLWRERKSIEADLGYTLEWRKTPKEYELVTYLADVDPDDESDWRRQHEWLARQLNELHRVFSLRIKELNPGDLDRNER